MNNNNENVIVSESRIAYGGVGIAIMMISLMAVIKFIPEAIHDSGNHHGSWLRQ